jgi:hypothetical protein
VKQKRIAAQLLLGAVCVALPIIFREQWADMPALGAICGMAFGLTPILIPTNPRRRRPSLDRVLAEAAQREGLTPEQVEQLRKVLEDRARRPALRFRLMAGCVLYLVVCVLFGVLFLVVRATGRWQPLLGWWAGGFLWGLLGSVAWTVLLGGRYLPADQATEQEGGGGSGS